MDNEEYRKTIKELNDQILLINGHTLKKFEIKFEFKRVLKPGGLFYLGLYGGMNSDGIWGAGCL